MLAPWRRTTPNSDSRNNAVPPPARPAAGPSWLVFAMPARHSWSLARDIHVAQVGRDVVFLDVRRDAYHCLADGADALTAASDSSALKVADERLAHALASAELVIAAPPQPRPPPPAPPARSALADDYPQPHLFDVLAGARALGDLITSYHGRPIHRILSSVRTHGASAASPPSPALLACVNDFHRWVPYAPVPGKCLVRSLLLLRHLRRGGYDAQWVFGVATWPFRAHCWLQCGDVVLDDHPDRLRPFSPILVI